MEAEKKTSYLPLLAAGLGGIALGVGVGMLIAPDKGTESRKKLASWLKDKREKSRERIAARKEQVEAAISAGRKAFREVDHKKPVGV